MEKLFLFVTLLSIFYSNVFSQGCLPEGITFTTQEQIDNFQTNYPGCTEIEGYLKIGVWPGNNSISNLNGLSVLTSIGGSCIISCNNYLQNLIGLDNITTIGFTLDIEKNINLTSLNGLENLVSIEKDLTIFENPLLINLNGLENLASIGEELRIFQNDGLINLSGINNLSSIGLSIHVFSNETLTSLSSLGNITSLGYQLAITQNYALTSLNGLENITSVGYEVAILNNTSLTSLSPLENIASGLNRLTIQGNDVLTSLAGLDNLDLNSLDNLLISVNYQLSECDVLSICNFLNNPTGNYQIAFNSTGCNSIGEVQSACLTSVAENPTAEVLLLSPNPASSFITITTPHGQPVEGVIIYNHLGQKILTAKPVNNTVDVLKLKAGLYAIEILTEDRITRTKFLKH